MTTFRCGKGVFVTIAMLCFASCFALRIPGFWQDTDSAGSKLTSLREERRDVLKTRVEMIEALFKITKQPYEAVLAARDDLLDAEYELATNRAQRIAVVRQKLVNAKEYEAVMEQRKRDASASQAEVLMATARCLGVEIELLRMQE